MLESISKGESWTEDRNKRSVLESHLSDSEWHMFCIEAEYAIKLQKLRCENIPVSFCCGPCFLIVTTVRAVDEIVY